MVGVRSGLMSKFVMSVSLWVVENVAMWHTSKSVKAVVVGANSERVCVEKRSLPWARDPCHGERQAEPTCKQVRRTRMSSNVNRRQRVSKQNAIALFCVCSAPSILLHCCVAPNIIALVGHWEICH